MQIMVFIVSSKSLYLVAPLQGDEQPTSALEPLRRETQPQGPAGKRGVWLEGCRTTAQSNGAGGCSLRAGMGMEKKISCTFLPLSSALACTGHIFYECAK